MRYAPFLIKIILDDLEKLGITFFEVSPERIRDQIRVLHETRCLGVDEERNVRQVVKTARTMASEPEFCRESLQSCFHGALVEDNDTTFCSSGTVQTHEEAVKPRRHLFERKLDGVLGGNTRLLDDSPE